MNIDITYQIMLPAMLAIYKYTHSYGLTIIVLTLAVRAAVWPLVGASTKNMKRMQLLQPKMKQIQERYKDDPENLQKKMMEFYSLNKFNPAAGCLPMLIQLPLLLALFGTFNGPPFGDKPIDVKVNVIEAREVQQDPKRLHQNQTSGGNSPYVSPDMQLSKVVVGPGDSTVAEGQSIDFSTRAPEGVLPADFKVRWGIKQGNNFAPKDAAFIEQNGHATFYKKGEYYVQAIVDGIAKEAPFGPIKSLGKKPCGMDLLKPENFDQVFLIVFFGVSMYLSSKLTMGNTTKPEDMDENQRVQADTMKYLPLIMTVSFFMMPLPTGVYIYMNVSNLVQTFQTWLFMKGPVPPLVDPDEVGGGDGPGGGGQSIAGSGKNGGGGSAKTIDIGPAPKNGKGTASDGETLKFNQADPVGEGAEKRKPTKKKKKK